MQKHTAKIILASLATATTWSSLALPGKPDLFGDEISINGNIKPGKEKELGPYSKRSGELRSLLEKLREPISESSLRELYLNIKNLGDESPQQREAAESNIFQIAREEPQIILELAEILKNTKLLHEITGDGGSHLEVRLRSQMIFGKIVSSDFTRFMRSEMFKTLYSELEQKENITDAVDCVYLSLTKLRSIKDTPTAKDIDDFLNPLIQSLDILDTFQSVFNGAEQIDLSLRENSYRRNFISGQYSVTNNNILTHSIRLLIDGENELVNELAIFISDLSTYHRELDTDPIEHLQRLNRLLMKTERTLNIEVIELKAINDVKFEDTRLPLTNKERSARINMLKALQELTFIDEESLESFWVKSQPTHVWRPW